MGKPDKTRKASVDTNRPLSQGEIESLGHSLTMGALSRADTVRLFENLVALRQAVEPFAVGVGRDWPEMEDGAVVRPPVRVGEIRRVRAALGISRELAREEEA